MVDNSKNNPENIDDVEASNVNDSPPNITLNPSSYNLPLLYDFYSKGSSNKIIREKYRDETSNPVTATAGLIERILKGEIPIRLPLLWIVLIFSWLFFMSWLFIHDNDINKVESLMDLKGYGIKVFIYSIGLIVIGTILSILACMANKSNKS